MGNRVPIFLSTRILVKTLIRKFHVICAKSSGDLEKIVVLWKFHNDSSNIFVNISKGNCFFIFLTIMSKLVDRSWKVEGMLKSSIPFILKHIISCIEGTETNIMGESCFMPMKIFLVKLWTLWLRTLMTTN